MIDCPLRLKDTISEKRVHEQRVFPSMIFKVEPTDKQFKNTHKTPQRQSASTVSILPAVLVEMFPVPFMREHNLGRGPSQIQDTRRLCRIFPQVLKGKIDRHPGVRPLLINGRRQQLVS